MTRVLCSRECVQPGPWLRYTGPLANGKKRWKARPFVYRYCGAGAIEIKLTQGQVTKIDAADLLEARAYNWYAYKKPSTGDFYAYSSMSDKTGRRQPSIRLHRVLLGVLPGSNVCDHKNGNTLDNRRSNLRPASISGNTANGRKIRTRNNLPPTSRFKGVSWHKPSQRWRVRVDVGGKQTNLGYFSNEEAAAKAYDNAARSYHGEFARTNADLGLYEAA